MSSFSRFDAGQYGPVGFRVVSGREQGLGRLMVVEGRLPKDDYGPIHSHQGDEVIRVLDGEMLVRVGDERKMCRAGDVIAVPRDTMHGFVATTACVLEVVAEYDIGTFYPVRQHDGGQRLIEVFREDMPWGRTPPEGGRWTSDEEIKGILASLDVLV